MKSKTIFILVVTLSFFLAVKATAFFPDSWVKSNSSGFGDIENHAVTALEVFNETLWAGTANESGAQLYKLEAESWSPVITDGFTNTNNILISDLISFKSRLYVSTRNTADGGQILRSEDGINWETVTPTSLAPSNGEVVVFSFFQGMIYAGTGSYHETQGAGIWRSNNGNEGNWDQVVTNGFNLDGNNKKVVSIQEYQGVLLASTENTETGAEVWSSNDGEAWEQVNAGGFGNPDNHSAILQEFGSYFYAGTENNDESEPGLELWRCQLCDGSDWVQVPVEKGFGDAENRAIRSFDVYNGVLYVLTDNASTGMEVWATYDGTNWEQANLDGFGDSNNQTPNWDNSIETFLGRLYVGTRNAINGGEIWRYNETTIYLPLVLH